MDMELEKRKFKKKKGDDVEAERSIGSNPDQPI